MFYITCSAQAGHFDFVTLIAALARATLVHIDPAMQATLTHTHVCTLCRLHSCCSYTQVNSHVLW